MPGDVAHIVPVHGRGCDGDGAVTRRRVDLRMPQGVHQLVGLEGLQYGRWGVPIRRVDHGGSGLVAEAPGTNKAGPAGGERVAGLADAVMAAMAGDASRHITHPLCWQGQDQIAQGHEAQAAVRPDDKLL